MTSSKLIGRETMIARLIDFHTKRLTRVNMQFKLELFSYAEYSKKNTRQICKGYDETFGEIEDNYNSYETMLTLENENMTEAEKEHRMEEILKQAIYPSALLG